MSMCDAMDVGRPAGRYRRTNWRSRCTTHAAPPLNGKVDWSGGLAAIACAAVLSLLYSYEYLFIMLMYEFSTGLESPVKRASVEVTSKRPRR